MIIFFMGFFLALLVFTEFNTKEEHSTSTTLFKRGSAAAKQSEKNNDDEEQIVAGDSAPGQLTPTARGKEGLAMKDIFSWQNLNYDITMPNKEERRLLSDIHGYVAPGKLTALMGESGAGKVRLLLELQIDLRILICLVFAHRLRCSMFWQRGRLWVLLLGIASLMDGSCRRISSVRRECVRCSLDGLETDF